MRALAIERTGGPDELRMMEVPDPIRVSDEVLVRVIAAGVNPIDAKTRGGNRVSQAITAYPAVLGQDFAGVVVETPYAEHPLRVGDRVYGMGRVPRTAGSYAELVAVSSLSVAPMPASLGFAEAAAVPLAALTAWGAVVETAKAHEGQRMLIHAASGGVGHFALQFARVFGAEVTATGSARNVEFLRALGADHVVDYTAGRFEELVADQDVVIDLIGNVKDDTGSRSLDVLRSGGLIVNVPTGSWPTMAEEAEARGVRATGYAVAPDGRTLAEITRLIDDGTVRVRLDGEFPLEAGAEAHRRLEAGHVRGKLVLRVAPDPA